jgi:hypothetical protein
MEQDGRDVVEATNRLRDVIPSGAPLTADMLFAQLVDLAEMWGPQSGQITAPMLRAELERRGALLSAALGYAADLQRVTELSRAVLTVIPAAIAGTLQLPRQELVATVETALEGEAPLLLTGPAGVGKSSLASLAVASLAEQGASVVALRLIGRTGQRLAEIQAEFGATLAPLLRAAPTNRPRVLFIDGAEQALADGGALLGDLLRLVPLAGGDAPPWHIVVTARDEAAEPIAAFIATATGRLPQRLAVTDLSDAEIEEVLGAFPVLRPLDRHPRPRRLLRRLYIIDLLVRSAAHSALPDAVLGEESVLDTVYDRLVRRSGGALPGRGTPYDRSDVFLALAESVLAGDPTSRLDGRDAEAHG